MFAKIRFLRGSKPIVIRRIGTSAINTYGPEIDFVRLCACVEPGEVRCAQIRRAVSPSLQWDLVYDMAMRQRIFPLMYENINKMLADSAPAYIFNKLKVVYSDNVKHSMFLSFFLIKLLRLFEENKICAVPFKGPVLADKVYGDIGRRFFADLDILVSRSHAKLAWNLLLQNGFAAELAISDSLMTRYIKDEDNVSFRSNASGVIVELHWELSGNYLSKPLIMESLSGSLRISLFHKKKILSLSDEYLLLYLCIHGAKHEWAFLELVCCVAELIRKSDRLNWRLVDDLAGDWRCRKILDLGVYLSWVLLGSSIPEMIQNRIKAKHDLSRLAQTVVSRMFQKEAGAQAGEGKRRFSHFHLSVRDSWTDQWRYLLRLLFSPTKKEWESFSLPAHFLFLRYLLRPFRLIWQCLKIKSGVQNA